jgi:hypothetical protein
MAKFYTGSFIETQTAEKAARNALPKFQRITQVLDGIETGKLTPMGTTVAQYANALGVPIDSKLPNKEAAIALTGQLALELRNPAGGAGMPGALSDSDRNFLVNVISPSIAQTPQGRALVIDTKVKILQRDMEVAQMARDYRKKHGQLDDGFAEELNQFSAKNPLFPTSQSGASSGGNAMAAPKPGTVDGNYTFKGGDPANRANWEKR